MGMSQLALPFTDDKRQRANTTEAIILSRLHEGPVTRNELIHVHHRFSAAIQTLREKGHSIGMETPEDGNDIYTWLFYTPMVKVTRQMQEAYYRTPHWQETRLLRYRYDDHKCVLCHGSGTLNCHHWNYQLFAEPLAELMTCCDICHEWLHELENIRVHFPRYVTPAIAVRLNDAVKSC